MFYLNRKNLCGGICFYVNLVELQSHPLYHTLKCLWLCQIWLFLSCFHSVTVVFFNLWMNQWWSCRIHYQPRMPHVALRCERQLIAIHHHKPWSTLSLLLCRLSCCLSLSFFVPVCLSCRVMCWISMCRWKTLKRVTCLQHCDCLSPLL